MGRGRGEIDAASDVCSYLVDAAICERPHDGRPGNVVHALGCRILEQHALGYWLVLGRRRHMRTVL